jgi:sugar phosphate isomerase/epimerase
VHGKPKARQEWAVQQLKYAAKASNNLGLNAHATFSGSLLWQYFHPWPQRPAGLVEEGFAELAKRWLPILNEFDQNGVDLCYEIHPGEDLLMEKRMKCFLKAVNNHSRACILYDPSHFVLQQLDYIQYIDFIMNVSKRFMLRMPNSILRENKELLVDTWLNRAGRYRSPGDGQVDFKTIFSKLSQYDFKGWAVMGMLYQKSRRWCSRRC